MGGDEKEENDNCFDRTNSIDNCYSMVIPEIQTIKTK